ncbi:hypothetical protein CkaCkLH20_04304 [Colletotrichum karsti]|uniref:Hsp70 family chaperone n=1 Tax=Colletotrichum karsti TaxID=1095194 RepID=A0A9P6LMJ3_9PEZI|nr:uncharacterized protein CkaCkLH20_04304 [Colletotrichum karsti]KAF9878266.1 hypothetical protein CkaCkLH20_04304 [Colletotrichum karsti]
MGDAHIGSLLSDTLRVNDGQEQTIVIGIDFGTTWAFAGQPKNIEVITQWPSELSLNSDTEKAPSTILYGPIQDETFWGYGVPADRAEESLKWFKLLLIDSRDLAPELQQSPQIATARRLLEESNRDVVEVISTYLRHLWNHSIDCITRATGKGLLRLCTFHVVITVPAIWPEYSKIRMRQAAEDAGILETRPAGDTVLSFASEPEVAALATMYDLRHRPDIKNGDHFVVCDAGGGTVDLISYEIVTVEPMVVKEAVKGDGWLCGGVFLDQAFVDLMRRTVGPDVWDAISKDEVQRLLHSDWEHGIKRQFFGQQKDWIVTLPYGCRPTIGTSSLSRKPMLTLNHPHLDPVFGQISSQVEELVQKQVQQVQQKYERLPKYVILVGGFGRCPYLHNRLVQSLGNEHTEVLQAQGSRPWSAICRGAVIRGLSQLNRVPDFSVKVESRIARVNYGTNFYTTYNPSVHLAIDRAWDEIEMKWVARNQMEWYLKQGTDVCEASTISHKFYRLYERPPNEILVALQYSTASPAPKRGDATVKRLCTIAWNKRIDFESLPTYTNPAGRVFYRLEWDMTMVCDGISLDFTIVHDGKRMAAKNVRVKFGASSNGEVSA